MSKAQVMRLVSELKLSETEKVDCGKRLIAFYDSLADQGENPKVLLKSLRKD